MNTLTKILLDKGLLTLHNTLRPRYVTAQDMAESQERLKQIDDAKIELVTDGEGGYLWHVSGGGINMFCGQEFMLEWCRINGKEVPYDNVIK